MLEVIIAAVMLIFFTRWSYLNLEHFSFIYILLFTSSKRFYLNFYIVAK